VPDRRFIKEPNDTGPLFCRRWVSPFPFIWQPLADLADRRSRQIRQQLRHITLGVDGMPTARAGERSRLSECRAVQYPRMKRFRRWLFNGLAALSLLSCVTVAALWVRSYFFGDVASFATTLYPVGASEWFVRSNFGVLLFARNLGRDSQWTSRPPSLQTGDPNRVFCGPLDFNFVQFGLRRYTSSNHAHTFTGATVPYWFPAALTSLLPMIWLWSRWRSPRDDSTLCQTCGYDLRATLDRCPECGTIPPIKKIGSN
jgi:hypothetical protein